MIQRSWVGRAGELRKLGAPTRGLDTLFAATNSPAVQSGLRRLAALSLPDTLVHGDLHPYNAVVEPAGMRIIDWSDAAIAHPFVDLAAALYEVKEQDERRALHDAYLEPWVGVLPPGQLREAALLGEMAGCIYQAISYRAITESMEPSDRWLFAGYDREWLERAEDLGKALQPG